MNVNEKSWSNGDHNKSSKVKKQPFAGSKVVQVKKLQEKRVRPKFVVENSAGKMFGRAWLFQ